MSVLPINELVVPADATTLDGFRRWRRTLGENAPKVHFIDGDLWFDMSPQSYRSHLPVTAAINAVLWSLATDAGLGRYFGDGGWVTHEESGLSNEPDGFLVLWETFRSNRAQLAEGSEAELVGRPDMVLEVVSESSVKKDTEVLRHKYAQAGVTEFWLVDARGAEPAFELLALADGAYAPVEPDAEGYRRSLVWGRAFRLRRVSDPLGQPDYRLDVLEAGDSQ
jgi:Uma2 family endonuclease